MRIMWDGSIIEIKSLYINKFNNYIKVEYWENYFEANQDGASEFSIGESCFRNGVKDFDCFIKRVKTDLLEKGFFDFDQDYLKLIEPQKKGK